MYSKATKDKFNHSKGTEARRKKGIIILLATVELPSIQREDRDKLERSVLEKT